GGSGEHEQDEEHRRERQSLGFLRAEDERDRKRRDSPGIDLPREANVPEPRAQWHEKGISTEQEIDRPVDGGKQTVRIEKGVREDGPVRLEERGLGREEQHAGEGQGQQDSPRRRER